MQDNSMNINEIIIKILDTYIPSLVSNSDLLFSVLVLVFTIFIFALWLYCAVFMFLDYRKRDRTSIISFALFILGIALGPIALVFYLIVRPRETLEDKAFVNIEHRFYYHQAAKVLDCLDCEAYVVEGHQFCTNCGLKNRFKCEKCGFLTDYDDNFCPHCGFSFKGRYEKIISDLKEKEKQKSPKKKELKISVSIEKANIKYQLGRLKSSLHKVKDKSKNSLKRIYTVSREKLHKVKNKASSLKNNVKSKNDSKKSSQIQ